MSVYSLTFDLLGLFSSGAPQLSVSYGDQELGVEYAYSGTTSVNLTIDTGSMGFDSTLLRFSFIDSSGEVGDAVRLTNLKIDGNDLDYSDFSTDRGAYFHDGILNLSRGGYTEYDASVYVTDTMLNPPSGPVTPAATVTGTTGDDNRLYGTNDAGDVIDALAGNDYVVALDGDDTINAGDGNDYVKGQSGVDTINGGNGADRLYGGNGNDIVNGGADNDRVYGNDGDDVVRGDGGNDRVYGNAGDDDLYGGTGNDNLSGGAGADELFGEDGDDHLFGGDDNDILHGGNNNDRLRGNAGNDELHGDAGDDDLNGQDGNDTLYGGIGNDTLNGEDGNDILNGDGGNDYLIGGQGADTLNGGDGDDIIYGGGMSTVDQYLIRDGSAFGLSGVMYLEETQSFYRVVTGAVNISSARSGAAAATLNGVAGHIVNITSAFESSFIDGLVNDIWLGGTDELVEGQWLWEFGAEAGTYFYDQSTQTSIGANYESWGGGEPNDYSSGEDYIQFRDGGSWNDYGPPAGNQNLAYVIEWNADDVLADNNIDTLNGGDGDDQLYGGAGNDILNGDADNDILYGQDGNDTLNGGTGNDVLYGQSGNDTLVGGAGDDTIFGDAPTQVIGQAGTVTTDQANRTTWHTVTFDAVITNPAVVMTLNTDNDTDPTTIRVRNVTDTGFEWQLQEWDYQDGVHGTETVSWIAIASGRHTLDNGVVIEAGTSTATNQVDTTLNFSTAFGSAPVVLSQVTSVNEASAVTTHNDNRTASSFTVHMEEEKANGTSHATEDFAWIAIDESGSVASGFLVANTGDINDNNYDTISFGSSFASDTPVLLAQIQNEDGGDPSTTRTNNVTSSQFDIKVHEEESTDGLAHTNETQGYVATTSGLLYADGDNGIDSISGGAGLDTLYGGDGADTFIFESASAFANTDIIMDFSYGQGDTLDISDLLTSFSGTITDHLNFVNSGGNTLVQVDTDGGANSFATIAQLNGITDLDESVLYSLGQVVV